MPGRYANDFSSECQIEATLARRVTSEICQNLWCLADYKTRHRERRRGCIGRSSLWRQKRYAIQSCSTQVTLHRTKIDPDILVQLVIAPDNTSQEHLPQDPWESIVSGLEALGGPFDSDEQRTLSVEEVPLIQADISYGDILRDGTLTHPSRPSLLAITMLPANPRAKGKPDRPSTPPIPPHPSIVQRRMELLSSDMLTRALTLVSRGQHDRAHHLLKETRTILKGLGKGGLPPLPPTTPKAPSAPASVHGDTDRGPPSPDRMPSPTSEVGGMASASSIDAITLNALDTELEASLEWINHPAVFGRDSRKAVLQAIGVIASQRGYTFRTPAESLWAGRVSGVKRLTKHSREWRDAGDEALMEEA